MGVELEVGSGEWGWGYIYRGQEAGNRGYGGMVEWAAT